MAPNYNNIHQTQETGFYPSGTVLKNETPAFKSLDFIDAA